MRQQLCMTPAQNAGHGQMGARMIFAEVCRTEVEAYEHGLVRANMVVLNLIGASSTPGTRSASTSTCWAAAESPLPAWSVPSDRD